MTVLTDHDIEGQARMLWGALTAEGWPDILHLQFAEMAHVGLATTSTDRQVWRYAQAHGMILLSGNRRMAGAESLARTILEENTPRSLPVLLIGKKDRVKEKLYRDRCVVRLAEILFDVENYLGVG